MTPQIISLVNFSDFPQVLYVYAYLKNAVDWWSYCLSLYLSKRYIQLLKGRWSAQKRDIVWYSQKQSMLGFQRTLWLRNKEMSQREQYINLDFEIIGLHLHRQGSTKQLIHKAKNRSQGWYIQNSNPSDKRRKILQRNRERHSWLCKQNFKCDGCWVGT